MTGKDLHLEDTAERLASEYVLGTLEGEARADFVIRLVNDPDLRALVAAWEERLSGLNADIGMSPDLELVPPPAELWQKIEKRIDAAEPSGTMTLRASAGRWKKIGPGVECKLLYADKSNGARSLMMRLAPGAIYPAHDHASLEECVIVEGDMIIGDLQLHAGDYHAVQAGTRHGEVTSQYGGVVFLRYAA